MQTHLENDSDFKDEVKRDPFKMMEMIKLKMHDPLKVKHTHMTLFKQLDGLPSTKQEEDEPLIQCTKKFKQVQDDVKSIVHAEWLKKLQRTQKNASMKQTMTSKKNSKRQVVSHLWHMHFKVQWFEEKCPNTVCIE